MQYYAGIGSRSTPPEVCRTLGNIARHLGESGLVLRSGHAAGADQAFERHAWAMEIFLPWNGFNGAIADNQNYFCEPITHDSERIAKQFHPAWHNCSSAARKLHIRNVHQILGRKLDEPVDMVVCWTPGGSGSGGTGQALRIASAWGIPTFDIAKLSDQEAFSDFLTSKGL